MILDCTLRDGGYVNNWEFSREQARDTYNAAKDSGMTYCEVGFRRDQDGGSQGPWYYGEEKLINETFSDIVNESCKIAVMAQMGTFTIDSFIPKSDSLITMVRVLIAYHCKNKDDSVLDVELIHETADTCRQLNKLGYETSINIGRIDKMSEEQIRTLCSIVKDVKFLYIADTYGNLGIYKMRKILATMKEYYSGPIGFHAHDNLQNASIKSIDALYNGASIVDVTFGGYGRGSGNAKAELVIAHMIMSGLEKYKLLPTLIYADKYVQRYHLSGVIYLLTGMWSMHVNYAIEVIEKHTHLPIETIYKKFKKIVHEGNHNFYFTHALL